MKRTITSVAVALAVAGLGLVPAVWAQQPQPQPPQPQRQPQPPQQAKGAVNDALFVLAAYAGGLAEVTTGNIALLRSTDDQVKKYAQHLIDDHTRANQQLVAIAAAKQLPVPTAPDTRDQAAADRINGLQGEDFDREFSRLQVVAHMDAVALFQAEAERGLDPDVKAFAAQTLPALREHLRAARQLAGPAGERPEAKADRDHADHAPKADRAKDDDRDRDDDRPKADRSKDDDRPKSDRSRDDDRPKADETPKASETPK
ncbi:MAG TPA: DUF4142 domain-containing protein [Isosphaeraceae bacterium]